MPLCDTKYQGTLEYSEESVIGFPLGLFGFETEKKFLALEPPGAAPVVLLQSASTPQLCFITLPVLVVDPHYRLAISAEDFEELGLPPGRQPRIGEEVLCLVLITIKPGRPTTANLLAPLVVNLKTMRAVQAISMDGPYSHQQAFLAPEEQAAC